MTYAVLIVDDMPDEAAKISDLVSALLNCTVEVVHDRFEAWAKVQRQKYDVLVLDLDIGGLHEGKLLLQTIKTYLKPPPGTIIISRLGNEPATRELKARFKFVVESIAKDDLLELTETLKQALERAIQGPGVPIVRPLEDKEEARSQWARKAAIVAAIIGALGAILAAVLRVVFKWP